MARQSIDFSFIPTDVIQRGGEIKIDSQNQKVLVMYPKSPSHRKNAETQTDTSCDKKCDLASDMFDLIPSVCAFLSDKDPVQYCTPTLSIA